MEAIDTKTIGKYRIDIIPDECPPDPREDDNLGTMVCFHSRYSLGDKHNFSLEEAKRFFEAEESKWMVNNKAKIIVLPLYLYDHSGVTMNTTGYSCPWDSGLVGWIYVEKDKVRKEYGWHRISKMRDQKIRKYLRGEVQTYDQYLTGDVYGFRITDTDNDEEVDSCWGYYGDDYCMKEAESMVMAFIEQDKKVESIETV